MNDKLPCPIVQGEQSRLFPVLSVTSKEGRTTSILLSCLSKIDELGRELLASAGQRVGARSSLETFTEVVPAKISGSSKDRPDGMIVLQAGKRQWMAFVEAKVGNSDLNADQVERYRALAKENNVDCVVTISNQFATTPTTHPLEAVRKSRSRVPVIHWSWMHILTTVDLLISRNDVADRDQLLLLNELRRFLTHDSAGVRGFDRMPREWSELNKLVSGGGIIAAKSPLAQAVLDAWHQETRDLSLILSRMTETHVDQKLSRKHTADPALRHKDELTLLREQKQLQVVLAVPNAAAPLEVVADLARRTIEVGMTLRAPEDKKSVTARLNWLLRQIKEEPTEDLIVRINWPGASPTTQHTVKELQDNVDVAKEGKERMTPSSFHLFSSTRLGSRFIQQANFIADIEQIIPDFYGSYGSRLTPWKKPAPRIKTDRTEADDVSTEALSEDAGKFEADK